MEPNMRRQKTRQGHYTILWKWYRYRSRDTTKKWESTPVLRWVLTLIHTHYLHMRSKWQPRKHSWKPVLLPRHIERYITTQFNQKDQLRIHSAIERIQSSIPSEEDDEEEDSQSQEGDFLSSSSETEGRPEWSEDESQSDASSTSTRSEDN